MEFPPPKLLIWLAHLFGSITDKEATELFELREQKERKDAISKRQS